MRATTARLGQSRPGFLATSVRIVWVLTLTISAVVGAVLWQARTQCPEPPHQRHDRPAGLEGPAQQTATTLKPRPIPAPPVTRRQPHLTTRQLAPDARSHQRYRLGQGSPGATRDRASLGHHTAQPEFRARFWHAQ
jgi:hypothetical protein